MTNLFDMSGKVALVTGGSGGIGHACGRRLVELGYDVVLTARREDRVEQVFFWTRVGSQFPASARDQRLVAIRENLGRDEAAQRMQSWAHAVRQTLTP